MVKTQQQIIQTPSTNNKALNIQQIPQMTSQIQVKEAEEGEDLNKYFQIPTNLSKAKTTNPANVQMNEIQMQNIIGQNQSQKEEGNVASVLPITDNDDINKYFKQLTQVPPSNNLTDEEILNKYFSKTTSQEVKPEEIIHNNLNIQNIVDMKDLPPTFGSNDINNFQQTTTTTTTKTTGNVDLRNLPTALTSSEVNKIIEMKDLPATFGSNDINNFKQTTTTTTTKTTANIPGHLTESEIKKIIDMKDLPETFGSSNISNVKKTTVTTTTTTKPANIDLKQFGLEQNPSMSQFASEPLDLKQFGLEPSASQISTSGQNKQVTTVTKTVQKNVTNPTEDYSKYFQNVQTSSTTPVDLHQFGLEKNASNISNILQGSNITFRQPGQSIVSSSNLAANDPFSKTSGSQPAITNNDDYSKYFQTTKTTTTSFNQTGVPYTTNVNLNNYGINIPQGKTTTTTTTTKTTNIGVPTSSTAGFTNSYTIPNATANNVISYGTTQDATSNYNTYGEKKVTTTKVVKSHVAPTQSTQSYSYNYSYQMPTTTKTTVTKTTYSGAA